MDNSINVTRKVLTILNIRYTNQYLKDSLLSHPNYPSLLAISDTLDTYNINSLAVKITAEKLEELPLPCIVQVGIQGTPSFYVLKEFSKDNEIVCINDKNKIITQTKDAFLDIWTGTCLLVEKSENAKEPGIEATLKSKKTVNVLKGVLVASLIGWLIVSFAKTTTIEDPDMLFHTLIYTVLKVTGLTIGVLLLWFEVDRYNATLQSFCSGGKTVNCNTVLGSKYASIFSGNLSLSLIGFSYFFGTLAYLIVNGFSTSSMALLALLSFTTLPAIVGSVYYQAVIIKQWCRLCTMLQAVLAAEILIVLTGNFYSYGIAPETLPLLFTLLLMPVVGWKVIKPLFERNKKVNLYQRNLRKIKNNPAVLETLLTRSRKIATSTEGLGISLKSATAKYHVIKVCNPYCGPCAKAHPVLEELVNNGTINLQILFTARASSKDRTAVPVKHFLAIDAQGDRNITQAALDTWYTAREKDYEAFAGKYPMNGELEQQHDKIKAMRNWCNAEKITHTPTIFINGYELPGEYTVADLKEVLT